MALPEEYECCRLEALRSGEIELTERDVVELYKHFFEGKFYVDESIVTTLQDFGEWLSGSGNWAGTAGAETVW